MTEHDNGMSELLELIKEHPEIINGVVFNATSILNLLASDAAKGLVLGVDVKEFLLSVAAPGGNGPIAGCVDGTKVLCKQTIHPLCLGGTRSHS